ncbi:DUF2203 family protein [Caldivirga sp.]|jgi:hypothetical protein|uniref:DUF2203 family protein n=1 Tax=Caldivirga sp. TaxID=2080243 RepID=UPI003D0E538E
MGKRTHVFTVDEANVIITEIKPVLGGLMEAYKYGELDIIRKQSRWLIKLSHRLGFNINTRLGIVHFPTLYKGNYDALLCYRFSEPRVMYWHWVDSAVRMRIRDVNLFGSKGIKNKEAD